MPNRTKAWSVMFLLGTLALLTAVATNGGVFLPALAVVFSGAALIDPRIAGRITGGMAKLFSGSALRSALILFGALMLIQLLPVELALLAAGDVLAYVEVVAAVSLIAANTRLKPLARAMTVRMQAIILRLRPRPMIARQARTRPALRRKAPPADSDGRGWAFA